MVHIDQALNIKVPVKEITVEVLTLLALILKMSHTQNS